MTIRLVAVCKIQCLPISPRTSILDDEIIDFLDYHFILIVNKINILRHKDRFEKTNMCGSFKYVNYYSIVITKGSN